MIIKLLLPSVLAGSVLAVQAMAAPVRQPTGKWIVDFDDAQCVASRDYGTKSNPLFLALKAAPLSEVMQIAVFSSAREGPVDQIDAEIAIGDRRPLKTTMLAYTVKGPDQRVFVAHLPVEKFADLGHAASISTRGKYLNESFEVSEVGNVLKLLDECVDDLRSSWNVSSQTKGVSGLAQPVGDLNGLLNADDYPAVAVRKKQSGTVKFILLIDEGGRIADCSIIRTSGVASLDMHSCGIVKKFARFKPALNSDGKPTRGFYVHQYDWRIHVVTLNRKRFGAPQSLRGSDDPMRR